MDLLAVQGTLKSLLQHYSSKTSILQLLGTIDGRDVTLSQIALKYKNKDMNPGLLVHHQFPELAQTHAHWVGDAIQPSHLLSSLSPALKLSQHQGLLK